MISRVISTGNAYTEQRDSLAGSVRKSVFPVAGAI